MKHSGNIIYIYIYIHIHLKFIFIFIYIIICSTLPLTIHIEPITMWKFNIYAVMSDSMSGKSSPMGGISASETDEVKRMFLETNPVLLGVTICVSLLHSLFEMLAFKNGKNKIKIKNDIYIYIYL